MYYKFYDDNGMLVSRFKAKDMDHALALARKKANRYGFKRFTLSQVDTPSSKTEEM